MYMIRINEKKNGNIVLTEMVEETKKPSKGEKRFMRRIYELLQEDGLLIGDD